MKRSENFFLFNKVKCHFPFYRPHQIITEQKGQAPYYRLILCTVPKLFSRLMRSDWLTQKRKLLAMCVCCTLTENLINYKYKTENALHSLTQCWNWKLFLLTFVTAFSYLFFHFCIESFKIFSPFNILAKNEMALSHFLTIFPSLFISSRGTSANYEFKHTK